MEPAHTVSQGLSQGESQERATDAGLQEQRRRFFAEEEKLATLTVPRINSRGELVIPFDADPRFHWWSGGQSLADTLAEVHAPPEVVRRYCESAVEVKR
jgi:hypothetical protein